MNYILHVSRTIWKIKNKSSNSTSYSDIALHMLVLMVGRLYSEFHVTSSFSIGVVFWRDVLREVYFKGPKHVWKALKTSTLNIDSQHPLCSTFHILYFTTQPPFWIMFARRPEGPIKLYHKIRSAGLSLAPLVSFAAMQILFVVQTHSLQKFRQELVFPIKPYWR